MVGKIWKWINKWPKTSVLEDTGGILNPLFSLYGPIETLKVIYWSTDFLLISIDFYWLTWVSSRNASASENTLKLLLWSIPNTCCSFFSEFVISLLEAKYWNFAVLQQFSAVAFGEEESFDAYCNFMPKLFLITELCKRNPQLIFQQFWQLKTWIHDNLCYPTIKSDTGQHWQD